MMRHHHHSALWLAQHQLLIISWGAQLSYHGHRNDNFLVYSGSHQWDKWVIAVTIPLRWVIIVPMLKDPNITSTQTLNVPEPRKKFYDVVLVPSWNCHRYDKQDGIPVKRKSWLSKLSPRFPMSLFLCFYIVLLRHWITITFTRIGVGLIWCDHYGQEYNAKSKFIFTLYLQIRLGCKVTTRSPLCITMCLLLQQECTMSKFWSFSFFSHNHRCSDLDAHCETSAYHW